MGIVSRLFPTREEATPRRQGATDWIDLSDYQTPESGAAGATTLVRFADIRALEDLKTFSAAVYDGSILILDFSKVKEDEVTLRRLTNELRKLATDTGGDIAGLGDHHILLTPAGIKVDRQKLKIATDDDNSTVPATSTTPRRTNGGRR